jgi:hypothetical protein
MEPANRLGLLVAVLFLLIALAACRANQERFEPVVPTGDVGQLTVPAPQTEPTALEQPTDSPEPTATQSAPGSTVAPAPESQQAISEEPLYRVVYVELGDMLNVRARPGVGSQVVGELAPGATEVEIVGKGEIVGGSIWVPVSKDNLSGWVNRYYLTEMVDEATFCSSQEARAVVNDLQEAIRTQDGQKLASLVGENTRLRLRRNWWNPEVAYNSTEVARLFDDEAQQDWGSADGSGLPIRGSFADVALPLLERDLLGAKETACDEILHGGTAGIVQLPEAYEGVNYYSLFRPPEGNEVEMDWGTWVAGIERHDGRFALSFLVHFDWEI